MELERYRRLILKQWPLIIACVIFTGIGAALGSQLLTKLYQSRARVQVDFPATDPSVVVGVDHLVTTEVQKAMSEQVLSQVAAKYPGLTYKQLSGEVTAAAFTGSQLFVITVLDPSPTRAASLANDIADMLIVDQRRVLAADNAQAQQQVLQAIADTRTQLAAASADLTKLKAQNAGVSAIAAAQATVQSLQQQYDQLQSTRSAIQVSQANKSTFMHVADAATPSDTPKRPYLLLNVGIGLGVGVVLGLLIVALRDLLDQRVRSVRDVLDLLEWPVLAEVSQGGGRAEDLALADYQDLVASLAYFNVERPMRLVSIVSATRAESARAVAAELALVTAGRGQRTLLVDADLAHPYLAEQFGVSAPTGMSTAILASHAAQGGAIQLDTYMFPPVTVPAPMLRVLPAGPKPPNPSGLLKSRAARDLVRAIAASEADVAVFSAPPVQGTAAAAVALASATDGVIVVVELAQARKDQLLRMKTLLLEGGAPVLGCVLRHAKATGRKERRAVTQARPAFAGQPAGDSATRSPTGVPLPRG